MLAQVTHLHFPLKNFKPLAQKTVIAMGFFDGVHRGHQAVIQTAAKLAQERHLPLVVLTYNPYPEAVFKKMALPLRYLTPLPQKTALLSQLGVEQVYCLQLTSHLAVQSPQNFVDQVLMQLNPAIVVAGFDHLYGLASQHADMQHLAIYSRNRFEVAVVPALNDVGKVSSSRIRQALLAGRVADAAADLGRYHQTSGLVVHGDARGRTLGYPTVNIATPEAEWLPTIGVYAVKIQINERWYQGMASIGRNITFEAERPITVEINIFDFNDQVYGELVQIQWIAYLRGEEKFASADELVEQLHRDKAQAQALLIAVND
ncbi:riboflavin biosynthesis protein RibF [Convivina intestini]|uniref:Riboflavin biosynthesis protein n=1 Tax=Convivina intestini TaxID=1505726 RepID=A0A2U1DFU4_9LACO|nr:riboflavin biosynthesis protein RibF [Convivina intestini]PVY86439.1 riboflavin kinase/FMN adenylyltransferase [Convivina intestini]CAH1850289.1 Bifunctional riboflavin kinase/FMN adenylyltransferase [Convivina intestini]SDB83694.1 riboflavin kinase / FMN adenylyltransferase [Leuconostocaceae bacterium R-53105]